MDLNVPPTSIFRLDSPTSYDGGSTHVEFPDIDFPCLKGAADVDVVGDDLPDANELATDVYPLATCLPADL